MPGYLRTIIWPQLPESNCRRSGNQTHYDEDRLEGFNADHLTAREYREQTRGHGDPEALARALNKGGNRRALGDFLARHVGIADALVLRVAQHAEDKNIDADKIRRCFSR